MKRCLKCDRVMKKGEFTPEEFKKTFKVGDIVRNEEWYGKARLRITAIGEERVLFKATVSGINGDKDKERVSTMEKKWE